MRVIAHFLKALTGTLRRSMSARLRWMDVPGRSCRRVRPSRWVAAAGAANAGSAQVSLASEQVVVQLPRKVWLLLLGSLTVMAALHAADRRFFSPWLVTALESRFPRASIDDVRAFTGVVVLGGGEERLREAGRLARAHGHLKIFVSGAGENGYVWRQLGRDIAPDRIGIENRSRNTFENAQVSKSSAQPQSGERWLLVTSATHMPRAMGAFRSARFNVEPWPVHDLPKGDQEVAAVLQHEMLGLLWYWALGRTDALFPRP